ncbi:Uncharacterized methyltransferase PA5071 [hydrothermal vent metagenome]|uniref:16S rRNA (uracil(1498)-N(3))-methyltransferase n=1 Tax=hydrothermal vent metagenome TaxID=652676 RepID=A0A3B1DHP7_9ZZZZ
MNLILLFPEDFVAKNRVRLQDRRYKHIQGILKSTIDDELCVGLLNDKIGTGKIIAFENDGIELKVCLTDSPPKPLAVTLILCCPRPIVLKRLFSSITSLGVKKLILLQSFRVEKSFWKSPVLEEGKIEEQLILGLEQAKDTIMPEVILRKRFKPFVEDELPEVIKGTTPLVAHPQGVQGYSRSFDEPMTLMIGPEGGFVPYEIEQLEKIGFKSIKLGERVLRVETAVSVLLGMVL